MRRQRSGGGGVCIHALSSNRQHRQETRFIASLVDGRPFHTTLRPIVVRSPNLLFVGLSAAGDAAIAEYSDSRSVAKPWRHDNSFSAAYIDLGRLESSTKAAHLKRRHLHANYLMQIEADGWY